MAALEMVERGGQRLGSRRFVAEPRAQLQTRAKRLFRNGGFRAAVAWRNEVLRAAILSLQRPDI